MRVGRRWFRLAIFGIVGGFSSPLSAREASLSWESAFPVTAAKGEVYLDAHFVGSDGASHRLQLWRKGTEFLHRKTDEALDLYLEHLDGKDDYTYRLLDHRRRLLIGVNRNHLYRIGVFSDWFGLAHVLDRPKTQYSVRAAAPLPDEEQRACTWRLLIRQGEESSSQSRVCWSAQWGLPLVIRTPGPKGMWIDQFKINGSRNTRLRAMILSRLPCPRDTPISTRGKKSHLKPATKSSRTIAVPRIAIGSSGNEPDKAEVSEFLSRRALFVNPSQSHVSLAVDERTTDDMSKRVFLIVWVFALPVAAPVELRAAELMHPAPRATLDRLGGSPAITAVVDETLRRAGQDARIKHRFVNANMAHLRAELIEQICALSGGNCQYRGIDMKTAHRGMGITGPEFDALVDDLMQTLELFKVPVKEKSDLVALLAPTKPDIVEVTAEVAPLHCPNTPKQAPGPSTTAAATSASHSPVTERAEGLREAAGLLDRAETERKRGNRSACRSALQLRRIDCRCDYPGLCGSTVPRWSPAAHHRDTGSRSPQHPASAKTPRPSINQPQHLACHLRKR